MRKHGPATRGPRVWSSCQVLVAWVHSVPAGPGDAGGDVHYVSVCPSCIVSRIALADVSGHGEAVVALGDKLRELMQQYLRALEQVGLMRDLNQAVQETLEYVHYATMVAVGWHGRRGLLVMTNAGHPPPSLVSCCARRVELAGSATRERARAAGRCAAWPAPRHRLRPDSRQAASQATLWCFIQDGVSEATNQAGEELGRDGLMNLAREMDLSSAEAFGTQLASALRGFRGGVEPADDETIIVLQKV